MVWVGVVQTWIGDGNGDRQDMGSDKHTAPGKWGAGLRCGREHTVRSDLLHALD